MFFCFVKGIERVEKLLLRAFLTDNELDIVDQQNIVISVFFTEFRCGNIVFISDGIDQFVGKFLRSHIENFCVWIIFQHKMGDGMHQVGFPKTNASINKQRIVDFSRRFCHRKGCSMGQIIVFADNKCIKRVARIQIRVLNGKLAHCGCVIVDQLFFGCFFSDAVF